jgi:uncharacterized membrane protein YccF (DUF307 family)
VQLDGSQLVRNYIVEFYNTSGDQFIAVLNVTNIVRDRMVNYSVEHGLIEKKKDGSWKIARSDNMPDDRFNIPGFADLGLIKVNYLLRFSLDKVLRGITFLDASFLGIVKVVVVAKAIFCIIVSLIDLRDLDQIADFDSGYAIFSIFFGNALWMMLGGLEIGVIYIIYMLFCAFSIILMPIGDRLLSILPYIVLPFGRSMIRLSSIEFMGTSLTQKTRWLIWCITGGIPLAIFHLVLSLVMFCGIVTYPLAKRHFRIARALINPFEWESDVEMHQNLEAVPIAFNIEEDQDEEKRASSPILRMFKSPRKSKTSFMY